MSGDTDWRRCIQTNYSKLLTTIDTQQGLYGAMKAKVVLVEQTLERIWEIQDDTERISTLLEVIRQGDDNRFNKFCQALEDSGQLRIVNDFLKKCPKPRDYSDAVVSGESTVPIIRDVPLNSIAKNCLTRYWNDIATQMELAEDVLAELETERIFEPIQVKKLRDTAHRFKRNEQALKFLERRCQRHYNMFYKLLAKHGQQSVLYYMAAPIGSDVQQTPLTASAPPETERQPAEETGTRRAIQATDTDRQTAAFVCSGGHQPGDELHASNCETTASKEADLHSAMLLCSQLRPETCSSSPIVCQPMIESTSPGTNVEDSGYTSQGSNSIPQEPSQPAVAREPTQNEAYYCGGTTYYFQKPSDHLYNVVQRQISREDAYNILYTPGCKASRGTALIIANVEFKNSVQDREGTEVDIQNLQQIFMYLNIETFIHKNLSAKAIKEVCRKHRNSEVKKEHTIFVLFILSHGVLDCVLGTDGEKVAIDDLTTMFDGKNCENLRGKPRLFFIQACQGDKKTMGTSADVTDSIKDDPSKNDQPDNKDLLLKVKNVMLTINEKADEAVVLAAYPGYVAWRNADNGSYFVQFITQVFFEQAHEDDFNSMILKVTRLMDEKVMDGSYKQICVLKSTLKKKLYLLPY